MPFPKVSPRSRPSCQSSCIVLSQLQSPPHPGKIRRPPSTLLSSDLCWLWVTTPISKPWDRMTVQHYPLVSERSDDWPHRRLAKNRGTPCSRDCLTGAVCKHLETNTWRELTGTHQCDIELPMAVTWINVLLLKSYQDCVNDNMCVQPRHLGFHCDSSKLVCLCAMSI